MADAPLMVVDSDGVVTGWSRDAEQRYGQATAQALGLRMMDVLAADTRQAPENENGEPLPGLRLEPLAGAGWAVWAAGGPAPAATPTPTRSGRHC